MEGWGTLNPSPDAFVSQLFDDLDALVLARAQSGPAIDPSGADIVSPFVSPEGLDYQQLIQKFLL